MDELWKNPGNPGMIVVTSHASVVEDGRLFMERGVALEAIKRIPQIDFQCGSEVLARAVDGVYGFLPVRPSRPEERKIGFGLFQTRIQWDEPPDPELIKYSMDCLRQYVNEHSNVRIRMNFPGIGNGGLPVDAVAPLLVPLPATVTVCHQGEVQQTIPTNFTGFKTLYLQVERRLQEGRFNQAVELLMSNGYDIQSAMDQVKAVQRCLRERADHDAERLQRWRSSSQYTR
jgi:hypothetical protein